MPISDYVNISITRNTTGVNRTGFGIPLILAPVKEFYERTKEYASLSSVASDFGTSAAIYKKAAAIFAQSPKVRRLKVGRKYENVNAIQRIVFDVAGTGGSFKITWGAEETAAIAYDANVATIKAAIEALSFTVVTVTEVVAKKEWTIEFTGADGNKHQVTPTVTLLPTSVTTATVSVDQYGSAVETYADALAAIPVSDNDWYAVVSTTTDSAEQVVIAAAIETMKKIYVAATGDATVKTSGTTDIAYLLHAAGYVRSAVIYSSQASHNCDAAWVGKMLPFDAGSATWAFKTLAGETVDTMSESERTYCLNKKCNVYLELGGVYITENGFVASGDFIDNTIAIDFMQSRLEEEIFNALVTSKKIPYTDAGVGIVVGLIDAVLAYCYKKQLIDSGWSVDAPKVADISTIDRAARLLPDVTFQARMQGAIHEITIAGTVSV